MKCQSYLYPSEMKGQFMIARYEDIAREPRNETIKLFHDLNLDNIINENIDETREINDG